MPSSLDASPTSRNSACATNASSKTISTAAPRISTRRPPCAGHDHEREWPARRDPRTRSDPHPGRPPLHHDARRHGCRVIKVEPPDKGDDTRNWGPPFVAGEAVYFLGVNRNKRSLTLNMAVPAGQKILAGLIEKADVLIDNFRLGTLEKWGFTDAWFERHAPRLVRCSITGYGSSGPKSALPGYDFILQAESGLMSICGEPDGRPMKYGVAIVDVCTGMLASNSILAALNARYRTGRGQKVEVSLYETSLAMLVNVAANALVDRMINEALSHDGADAWLAKLKAVGIPCGKINSVAAAFDDPQTAARDMIETIEHSTVGALKMLGIPFKFSDTACSVRRPPPTLGQHNAEILAGELGLDDKAIAELRQAKVI